MPLAIHIFIIVISFFSLTRICDGHFIPSLDKIARRFKLSNEAAGATLMAVGSSAAELFIAIIALIKPGDHADIGVGTIVGSAIFNILAITGAAALVGKIHLNWRSSLRDLSFYALSIILLFLAFSDGFISLIEALIFIVLYLIYVITVIKWEKIEDEILPEPPIEESLEETAEKTKNFILTLIDRTLEKVFPASNYFLCFFISIFAIAILSWLLVESAVQISEILHVPEIIVGLTVLAIGSSIPDLVSSIIVSKQGRGRMAISNAIGSNVFDILFGLGFPWLLFLVLNNGPLPVNNSELEFSVLLLFISIFVVLAFAVINRWKIGRKTGILMILLYLSYLVGIVFLNL